jgi:hypothetical protein
MQRGIEVESFTRGVDAWGVHWVRSGCDSSSLSRNHLLVLSFLCAIGWESNSLSLHVARKQIWPVEGLLAAKVCTPVRSLWVVVQFVTSPVLGAGKDLDCELRVSF